MLSTMRFLVVDTASPYVTCGLVTPDGSTTRTIDNPRGHNEILIPSIMDLLAGADLSPRHIDAVIAGRGPGPFTGLRVGMATAAAFAQARDIPCYGVCSLDGIANAPHILNGLDPLNSTTDGGPTILVATDARRREIYWRLYSLTSDGAQPITDPAVNTPADVVAALADKLLARIAASASIVETLADLPGDRVDAQPDAAGFYAAAQAAGFDSDRLPMRPLYLRRPDAVQPAAKPISPAIGQEAVDDARARYGRPEGDTGGDADA